MEKVQIPAAKDKESLEDLLILSCEEDRAICLPLLEKGSGISSILSEDPFFHIKLSRLVT